jgi:hypothetical protein
MIKFSNSLKNFSLKFQNFNILIIILKNDKTIIAYHFGQCYGLLKKEWRLPKIEIGWLIKVLRNGCFHNGPVICPRSSHNGPRKVVLALGVASGQYNLPWAIITNLGDITGPLWKHPFINTISNKWNVCDKFSFHIDKTRYFEKLSENDPVTSGC